MNVCVEKHALYLDIESHVCEKSHTCTCRDTHILRLFSLESNKSVRQIERAGRPNSGVKHMLLRSSADRQQDHTNSACLAGRWDPTYLIYDIQYACDALYMPSVTCRPHYSMSAVLVSSLPAVVELNKRQYAKSMPGVMVLPPKYMSS